MSTGSRVTDWISDIGYCIDLIAAIARASAKFGIDRHVDHGGQLNGLEGEHARREQRMASQCTPVTNESRTQDRVTLRDRPAPVLAEKREIAWCIVSPLRVHGPEPSSALIMMNDRLSPRQPAPPRNSSRQVPVLAAVELRIETVGF